MNSQNEPKVCIILVNYNSLIDTLECVESIGNIDYKNYELIVVDNGSTESSFKKLKSSIPPKVVLIKSNVNLGFSGGNNIGINYAMKTSTEYILLLNNDTLVKKDFLKKLVCTAKKNKAQSVISGKILYAFDMETIWYAGGAINFVTSRTVHYGIGEKDVGQYNQKRKVTFISGCCMFIPRIIIEEVGLLEEAYFLYCEDLDYCCRIIKSGYSLEYEPEALIYHKVSATTGSTSDIVTYYMVRNKWYIIQQYINKKYRLISRTYNMFEILKRLISKEYALSAVTKGILDFKKRITGKQKEI